MARFEIGIILNQVMKIRQDIIRASKNSHNNSVVKGEVRH